MMELERHIESLLLHNDCVMVPGMGGFISHYESARYEESENTFLPPYRSLGFNPQLHLNDSVLVQSYMEVHHLSYDAALERMHHEVEEVMTGLRTTGRYELPRLGVFTINEEGSIMFEPKESGLLTPSLYGLDLYEFRPLTQEVAMDAEPYIRIKVRTLKRVAASAAAVFVGLLMVAGTFLGNHNSTKSEAGLISITKILPTPEEMSQEEDLTIPFTTLAKALGEVKVESKEVLPVSNVYSLVLACKIPQQNAELFARSIRAKGYEVEVVGDTNDSMVLYGHYPTDQEAYAALTSMRGESAFANAWILHR